jgi:hypothetical protein
MQLSTQRTGRPNPQAARYLSAKVGVRRHGEFVSLKAQVVGDKVEGHAWPFQIQWVEHLVPVAAALQQMAETQALHASAHRRIS